MTNRLNLMLHCGASSVTREQVEACHTPDPTDSWHPIPHNRLIELMEEKLPSYGLQVVNEAHGMHSDGSKYFGMFQVAGTDGASLTSDDFSMVVGLRNSHDKSFVAGLCMGAGVFVCDNLSFSAEIVVARRHTTHIMRDLPLLMSNAMGQLTTAKTTQDERIAAYKEHELTNTEADHLVCEAFRAGAIGKTRIADVLEQWRTPAHPEFEDRTAWSLFNGFTEVYKGGSRKSKALSVVNLNTRSERLHGVLDTACGILSRKDAIMDGVIDAEVVRA
jgi:hypothetical protein